MALYGGHGAWHGGVRVACRQLVSSVGRCLREATAGAGCTCNGGCVGVQHLPGIGCGAGSNRAHGCADGEKCGFHSRLLLFNTGVWHWASSVAAVSYAHKK